MSESSGSANFPTSPRPAAGQGQHAQAGERLNARLTNLPNDLQDVQQRVQLRGEIVRQRVDRATNESIIHVRTPRGEVEIRLPPEQAPPREGQQVDIEIPPGRPPTQARVEAARTEQTPQPPPQDTTVEERHPPRPSVTPVDVRVEGRVETSQPRIERPPETTQTQTPRSLPDPGTVVRLQPVTAREAAALIAQNQPEVIQALVSQLTEATTIKAQNIAAQVTGETLSAPINTVAQPTGTAAQNQIAPAIINAFGEAPLALPNAPQALSALSPTAAPPQQTSLPQSVFTTALPAPLYALTSGESTPAITTPLSLESTPALPQPPLKSAIDIEIGTTTAPRAELAIPGTEKLSTLPDIAATNKNSTIAKAENILQGAPPSALTATVIGTAPGNLPVLSAFLPQVSSPQNFILQAPAEGIPAGTQITFTPQASVAGAQAASALATALPPLSYFLTPGSWPAMEELYQTLARNAPATAQAFSNVVPNASSPAQVTPAMMFFMSAVRGGDISQWLGDKASDALRSAGRGNLLSRLTQEGGLLNRMSSEPVSQDWRALSLPMFYEGEIQKIALYYKHDYQNGGDDDQPGKQTRFVFDLALDAMGKVQVDGLFRPYEGAGRLDVVVRTEEHLSQAMQMDMRQTYAKALRQTEVTGELSFQDQNDKWVTIQAEDNSDRFGVSA